MARILIKAENISKQFRLGILGSKTVKEDLKDWWRKKSPTEKYPPGSPFSDSKD